MSILPAANLIQDGWSILSLSNSPPLFLNTVFHRRLRHPIPLVRIRWPKLFVGNNNYQDNFLLRTHSPIYFVFILRGVFVFTYKSEAKEGKVLTKFERELYLVRSLTRQKNWRAKPPVFIYLFSYRARSKPSGWKKLSFLWSNVDDG